MKVRPADLLGHLEGLLYCKWQRPPSPSPSTILCPCSPQPPLHAASLSVGSEVRFPKQRPLAGPQAMGTLTSSNDLQPGLSFCSSSTHHTTCRTGLRAVLLNPEPIATSTACPVSCPVTFTLGLWWYNLSWGFSLWNTPQDCALSNVIWMRVNECLVW